MIIEYSCSNYKSIKNKINFSMLASKDTTHEDELINENGIRMLKITEIYGANGSGKSNLIESIMLMKNIIVSSIYLQPGDEIPRKPHKLEDISTPTEFQIQFIKNNIRYAYGFSYFEDKIVDEYLYYYPNGKQSKIFERDIESFSFSEKFKKGTEIVEGAFKPYRLVLSCAANFTKIEEIEQVFLFFKKDIVVYSNHGINKSWLTYSLRQLQKDSDIKEKFLKFIQSIGTNIVDIQSDVKSQLIDTSELSKLLPSEYSNFIPSNNVNRIDAKVEVSHDKFDLNLKDESDGIKKLFEVLCPIIDIIENNRILLCDEIETHLHPLIVLELIKLFKHNDESNSAQLIYTTHNAELLDLELFRRDQIWFTELDNSSYSTDLYSLSEIKNVRKDENIKKGYIIGKYGAIPVLNSNIYNMMWD